MAKTRRKSQAKKKITNPKSLVSKTATTSPIKIAERGGSFTGNPRKGRKKRTRA